MMILDEFLDVTATRLPTSPELLALCDALEIKCSLKDGRPVISYPGEECRGEAMMLAMLFRREPFRTEVLKAKASRELSAAGDSPLGPQLPDEVIQKPSPPVPPRAVIVVADDKGYTDKAMKGPPYMWTWIGGNRWFHVRDHAVPMSNGKELSNGTDH
jgi:hypothetical protein